MDTIEKVFSFSAYFEEEKVLEIQGRKSHLLFIFCADFQLRFSNQKFRSFSWMHENGFMV